MSVLHGHGAEAWPDYLQVCKTSHENTHNFHGNLIKCKCGSPEMLENMSAGLRVRAWLHAAGAPVPPPSGGH